MKPLFLDLPDNIPPCWMRVEREHDDVMGDVITCAYLFDTLEHAQADWAPCIAQIEPGDIVESAWMVIEATVQAHLELRKRQEPQDNAMADMVKGILMAGMQVAR